MITATRNQTLAARQALAGWQAYKLHYKPHDLALLRYVAGHIEGEQPIPLQPEEQRALSRLLDQAMQEAA